MRVMLHQGIGQGGEAGKIEKQRGAGELSLVVSFG
jgi:hypothetical protein